jgi:hypothetical protein
MKTLFAVAAIYSLSTGAGPTQVGNQWGLGVGPTIPLAGTTPLTEGSFRDDFNLGYSFNFWFAGPVGQYVGWRGEIGWDGMPADADAVGETISADYRAIRFQAGVQIMDFDNRGKNRPYAFVTVGGVYQSMSISGQTSLYLPGNVTTVIKRASEGTALGLSMGGGINHMIGDNWGLGADGHLNVGFFSDATRWWLTPSGQVFFTW